VSVTLARPRRSRSLSIARCTGARRGWAARSMRCWALLSAATRGSRLPVSCACCCASRTADSMSTTRFSSRERDRLCISSSSWLRCSATSLIRVSATDSLAAVSRTSSCACRAMVRASMASAPDSADWRASCSWMAPSFCHSMPLLSAAAAAMAPSTVMARLLRQVAKTDAAGGGSLADDTGLMRPILSRRAPRAVPGGIPERGQSPLPGPPGRCAGAWPGPALPSSAGRAGPLPGGPGLRRC